MKTQLLQDFDESGSAAADATPAPPPAGHPPDGPAQARRATGRDAPAPPRPAQYAQRPQAPPAPSAAVWHRPQAQAAQGRASAGQSAQRGDAGAMGGAAPDSAGQMRPPGAQTPSSTQATQSRQHAAAGAWTGPRPLSPELRAAAADAHAREQARAQAAANTPPPADPAPAADLPDWLTERLREDAEQEADRQHKRLMARRALGWSAAATVVAMLAVGGYWFYQESRVEGALDVVANTSPAAPVREANLRADTPAAVPAAVPAPQPPAASAAIAARVPAPGAPASPGTDVQTAPGPADTTPDTAHAASRPDAKRASDPAVDANAAADPAAARAVSPVRTASAPRHRKPASHAEARTRTAVHADKEPTPAQRRWETLMQCRALGYDERECRQRGCMMTRFGLACPG